MQILNDIKLDYSDVLIQPKRSILASRNDVELFREFNFKYSRVPYRAVPIMGANMDTVGTMEMALALSKHGLCTALHKHYSITDLITFFNNIDDSIPNPVFYSMGIKQRDIEKLLSVSSSTRIDSIMIDVANGYSTRFSQFVEKIRTLFPEVTICAGNVVTYEMTEQLILSGADIVKIGIGPGSMCTTRMQTGVGYPQLSAVIECADAAHGLGGLICADGGCRIPADVAKAFGGGADFVMLGGMLSGHDECGGKLIYSESDITYGSSGNRLNIPTHMEFYGMSSKTAMDKHNGGVAEYRSSEGRSVMVPYRGPVENTVRDILGGLRSTCTYTGSSKLKELSKRTTFVRVNRTHEPFKNGD